MTRTVRSVGSLVAVIVVSACSAGPAHPSPVVSASATVGPPTASVLISAAPSGSEIVGLQTLRVIGGTHAGYTVFAPGWLDDRDLFAIKYPVGDVAGPVLGVSVWDIGTVYLDSCHWQGSEVSPGTTVDALVHLLVEQKPGSATKPAPASLAGFLGTYLELTVPPGMKSTTWTDFDGCDISDGRPTYFRWLGKGFGGKYELIPGQTDRLWVLDVNGQSLVVDATFSPDTSEAARREQGAVVRTIHFGT